MDRQYRKAWETFPVFKKWLRPSKDTTKAFCICCHCELNARHSDLVRHGTTKKHLKAMNPWNSGTVQPEINFQTKEPTENQKAQGMLCLYVAVHTSFSSIDHLSEVCFQSFPDSKAIHFKLHRTKCSNIITNIIAPFFIQNVVNDIKDVPFSLILDEGTDISVEKLLGVVVRYFSITKNRFITTFLGLIDLKGGTADDILYGLERLLNILHLDFKNLVAIGTDNAAVMTGAHKGLHKKIEQKYNLSNLVLVRCVCHSLQLAVCAATDKSFPNNLEFLVRESHNWFAHSPIRQKAYAKIYKLLNNDSMNPIKIPLMAKTRWLSIEKAVKVILQMWFELKTHFSLLKDTCYVSNLLKDMYSDNRNHVYLIYLSSILEEVQKVNLAFESANADHVKLFNDLYYLVKSITNRIIVPLENFDYLEGNLDENINEFCYLGFHFEKACKEYKIIEQDKQEITQNLVQFTKNLVLELRRKLPTNFKLLQNISLFSVHNIFSNNKTDIFTFIQNFINDPCLLNKIEVSLQNLTLQKWNNMERTDDFWIEVYNFKNCLGENPFHELAYFVIRILSFPYSNAEVERAFSLMNFFKPKIRNRLSLNSANALLHIKYGLKIENVCCCNYELPSSITSKINSNETYKISKYFIKTVLWPDDCDDETDLFENEIIFL